MQQQKTTVLRWSTVIYGVYCGSIQDDCVWKCVETTYAIFTALRCLSLHQIWTAAWQWVNSELPEIRKRVVFTFIAWRQLLSACILPLFALAFALLIFSPCWSNAFVQLGDSFVLFCDCLHGSPRRIWLNRYKTCTSTLTLQNFQLDLLWIGATFSNRRAGHYRMSSLVQGSHA